MHALIRPLTLALPCLALAASTALAQGDRELLGSWVGVCEENRGEVVTVGTDWVVVDGERVPLKFAAPGVVLIGGEERLAYRIQEGVLTTDLGGVRMTWRRAEPPAAARPEPRRAVSRRGESPVPAERKVGGTSATDAAPRGSLIMTRHVLRDPGVGNMESHSLLAPKGWKVEGGAWWANVRYFQVLPSRDIKVTSPDGAQVHLRPSVSARDMIPSGQYAIPRPREGSAEKGYPVIYMPVSLEDWKRWVETRGLPASYPGATEVRVQAALVPELTALLNRQIAPIRAQIQQRAQLDASAGMRSFAGAAFMAFECRYTHEGRTWHELMLFGVTYQGFESQLLGRQIYWSINPALSYRAPAGKLEASMPILGAIANSLRATPEWTRMRAEHQAKLNKIAHRTAMDASRASARRSRILADANAEIGDIIHKGYQQRSGSSDRSQRKLVDSIHGTQNYVVPGGQTSVQLPNTYSRVYTNGNGEYLLTNDRLYDPNTDSRINTLNWRPMQTQR